MHATLLPFIVLCPLIGGALLLLSAGRMPRLATGFVGVGSIGLAALLAAWQARLFAYLPDTVGSVQTPLWSWMHGAGLDIRIGFTLDALSVVMMLVVTGVGFLIHLYAYGYMRDDPDIARFFSYMNLFVAAMLVLVFANDLLGLYVGWEGVGVCSYLLIGFWYKEAANTAAANKAFVVTRIGDAIMLCGLLLLAVHAGTLDIATLTHPQPGVLSPHIVTVASFLLFGGAIAKSAQVPLQTWLPDAMAGPTPVSALIHAATMVTAGVYLIARLHLLFAMAPLVMTAVSVVGVVTLLLAAGAALVQTDIKRILAYSTMSQLGYMFLALGSGAWEASIFHLVTHAFFKALLFMTAGAIILRLHHEQDIFRMGGLARKMPWITAAFVAGSAALAGLPVITAGFYSKEMILQNAWHSDPLLWGGALLGAFMTSTYIFRCVFIVFLGAPRTEPHGRTGWTMAVPLVCLTVLALAGGMIDAPSPLTPGHMLSRLVSPFFGKPGAEGATWLMVVGSLIPPMGIVLAWLMWRYGDRMPAMNPLARLARTGWGFDTVYDRLVVTPFVALGRLNINDIFDRLSTGAAAGADAGGHLLGRMQNGQVRRYASWIAAGTVAALCLAVFS
ncbi:NADH-quinone oxidoreductase chain L [Neoasaia chiangmaiensis NBRC 101099]|uniref:NADH-quinone oxidoreductase subunit L n=1 Tax=Neoasaia chiangmaiensis TaxID=320497 RepID=A0A1U9KQ13_9PROT|nr:NADH-quinone oxidoreductase subunit L [Neoasaia chiangmaiensis]AQS87873.1 NADH-quinone oxidoreductase subunit L [Neoasaia chiangmaiensis]GBR39213.1 NADH-quinone oxidoreductase chain L [Neoasaia chiangmaiensis NBRC 101099]GEN15518.1 NADH:ubiquinone oxidoreductase subunit L [Neoasaia chiangmaiensis]